MKQNKIEKMMIKHMVLSLVINSVLSVLKIVVGIVSKSNAILSDGFHSLSDFVTDIVSIIGIKISNKKEDKEHPFGHGKFEYVTSLMVGFIILFFSYQLFLHILNGENTIPGLFGIFVIIFTVIVKLGISTFLIRKGKQHDNQILFSGGKESMNDVYSSLVVLVGLILAQFDFSFSIYLDKIISIAIVLLIAKTGIMVIVTNVNLILGVSADQKIIDRLAEDVLNNFKEVDAVDQFVLLKYGPSYKAILDIEVNRRFSVTKGHEIAHEVREYLLKQDKIDYVKVHVEPYIKTKEKV